MYFCGAINPVEINMTSMHFAQFIELALGGVDIGIVDDDVTTHASTRDGLLSCTTCATRGCQFFGNSTYAVLKRLKFSVDE